MLDEVKEKGMELAEMNIALFSVVQQALQEALEALTQDATRLFVRNKDNQPGEEYIQSTMRRFRTVSSANCAR